MDVIDEISNIQLTIEEFDSFDSNVVGNVPVLNDIMDFPGTGTDADTIDDNPIVPAIAICVMLVLSIYNLQSSHNSRQKKKKRSVKDTKESKEMKEIHSGSSSASSGLYANSTRHIGSGSSGNGSTGIVPQNSSSTTTTSTTLNKLLRKLEKCHVEVCNYCTDSAPGFMLSGSNGSSGGLGLGSEPPGISNLYGTTTDTNNNTTGCRNITRPCDAVLRAMGNKIQYNIEQYKECLSLLSNNNNLRIAI